MKPKTQSQISEKIGLTAPKTHCCWVLKDNTILNEGWFSATGGGGGIVN